MNFHLIIVNRRLFCSFIVVVCPQNLLLITQQTVHQCPSLWSTSSTMEAPSGSPSPCRMWLNQLEEDFRARVTVVHTSLPNWRWLRLSKGPAISRDLTAKLFIFCISYMNHIIQTIIATYVVVTSFDPPTAYSNDVIIVSMLDAHLYTNFNK